MKATIISGSKGQLVAVQLGHAGQIGSEAGLMAGPGQKLHVMSIPDELVDIKDPREFHYAILPHVTKNKSDSQG